MMWFRSINTSTWDMAHTGSPKHARIILFLCLRTKSRACTGTTHDKGPKKASRAWGEEHSREDEGVTPNPFLSRPAPVMIQYQLHPHKLWTPLFSYVRDPTTWCSITVSQIHGNENISLPNNCLSIIDNITFTMEQQLVSTNTCTCYLVL